MKRPINTLTLLTALCTGIGASVSSMPAFAHSLGTDFRSATDLGATTSWPAVRTNIRGTNIVGSLVDRGRNDDAHYFKFQVPSRVPVRIWTEGSTNTHGQLYDSDGLSINAQHGGGPAGGGNFFITSTLDPGTWYLKVRAEHRAVGRYRLRLESGNDDHGDSLGAATRVVLPGTMQGQVDDLTVGWRNSSVYDNDWFWFQVTVAGTVGIWTTSAFDTWGQLYDSDLIWLETDDDAGPGGNFLIARMLDPGIYYVRVTGYRGDSSLGPYTLHLDGDASGVATIPLFMSASNPGLAGFVRVVNHSAQATSLGITAVDDTGVQRGSTQLPLSPWQAVHFNSRDLETGNQSKGIAGVGSGTGNWYLEIAPGHPAIEVLPHVRTGDGFVTGMGNLSPTDGRQHWVSTFNPGGNRRQVSMLRLIHPMCPLGRTGGDCSSANVSIVGVDDAGRESDEATLVLQPGEARTVTAQQLETGSSTLTGALGEGTGKWRLLVTADQAIQVMSLLRSPTGHLSDLSPSAVPHGYTLPSGNQLHSQGDAWRLTARHDHSVDIPHHSAGIP